MIVYLPLFSRDGTFWTEESYEYLDELAVNFAYEQECCGAIEIDIETRTTKIIEKEELWDLVDEVRREEKESVDLKADARETYYNNIRLD